jgi:hypothetical protein
VVAVNNIVSSNFAIAGALQNINMPNIAVSEGSALRRWAAEAMRFVSSKGIFKQGSKRAEVSNNKIKVCDNFKGVECVKVNGKVIPHQNNSPCAPSKQEGFASCGCSSNSPDLISQCDPDMSQYSFFVQGCYIKFNHSVPDGTIVDVVYWELNTDEDGYVMIFEEAVPAIQEYIAWQLLRKYNKQPQELYHRRWNELVLVVRADLNKISNEELKKMGLLWLPHKLTAPRW